MRRSTSKGRKSTTRCDEISEEDLHVIDASCFSINQVSYDIQEKVGNGTYGATFLAIKRSTEETKQTQDGDEVVVKAIFPNPNGTNAYDKQEYMNQHYLACNFNKELAALEHTAKFPEVYFIGKYSPPPALTCFQNEGIQQSIVAGMVKLEHTLLDTLIDMLAMKQFDGIANLAVAVIKSVANTLKEVNKKGLDFIHGDLHVGNIMHDESRQNFHIIDFGAARMNRNQLRLDQNPFDFYKKETDAGSRGLDLMTLCLSLLDFMVSPYIGESSNELLSLLWYPLWFFFKANPIGRLKYHNLTEDQNNTFVEYFLNPTGPCFLGTGFMSDVNNWPTYLDDSPTGYRVIINHKKIQAGLLRCRQGGFFSVGSKIYHKNTRLSYSPSTIEEAHDNFWAKQDEIKKMSVNYSAIFSENGLEATVQHETELVLSIFFGYDAGDIYLQTLTFEPDNILSNEATGNREFMNDMRTYLTHNDKIIPKILEESRCSQWSQWNGCVVNLLPQFRTFTFDPMAADQIIELTVDQVSERDIQHKHTAGIC